MIRTIRTVTIAVATAALLSACGVGTASDTDSDESIAAIPVEVTQAVRADIFATYDSSATIASDADAPVVSRVSGEVVELLAEEGDKVTAGQVLARVDGERLRLEMLAAEANLKRAQNEYERNMDLHSRGLISESMFEGLKYDLAALEATYKLKRLNYGYSNIRATISGTVSSRDVKPGQNLAIGQVAFRITDSVELLAYLQIPQAELPKFSVGHGAFVSVASVPDARHAATITRISPTIDTRNGTFRATAIIDNRNGDLAPGMFGRFQVAYEKHPNALVIPKDALLDEDAVTAVYVVIDGAVLRREVTTGIESNGQVEILDGLTTDDSVVVVGQSGLSDGSKVLASVSEVYSYTG